MTRPAPALSTIAARNPTRAVQPTRKCGKSGNSDASKATNRLSTSVTREERLLLDEDVEDYAIKFQDTVTTLSIKHGRTELFIKKRLHNGATYAKQRGVNIWNAIMHDLSVKAKDAGDVGDLKTLRTKLSSEEYKQLVENLTDAERTHLLKQLGEHRGFKHRSVRATNKAVAMDGMQTAACIGDVLEDLFERTGLRAFAFFTCGDPDDPAVPHIVDSDNSRAYFQRVFGKSFIDFLRKFEQWSCVQDTEEKEQNNVDSVRKQIVTHILDGLRKIKNKKTIGMDYVNYKLDIKHKLGVELAGWPKDIPFERRNPLGGAFQGLSKVQRKDLAEELAELAGDGPRRKERSDKGKKRARREAGSDSNSDSDEEEDKEDDEEEDDDDGEEEAPAARTNAPAARAKAPAACAKAPAARTAPSAVPPVTSDAPASANTRAERVHKHRYAHQSSTPINTLTNFTTRTNAHDDAPSSPSSHTAPISMGHFNPHTNAVVPDVGATLQVFAAANNAGAGFDASKVSLNMPLQELLPDFALGSYGMHDSTMYRMQGVGSYGMPQLPSSYQGGGSYFVDTNPGGDSYGMQPLPSSYHGGGNHFANTSAGAAYGMAPSNNTANAGTGYYADPTNSYGMPPSSTLPAMDGFQYDNAALDATVRAALDGDSAMQQPTETALANTTNNTNQGVSKKRKCRARDAGDVDAGVAKKQRNARKKDAGGASKGVVKRKKTTAAAAGSDAAAKRKPKKTSGASA
ncbi:hypothetical protein B0H19DRAFT_1256834 [Mycena capillaripes]|nr:hypothetical protein B0H19DRAFT_1256834 [Mycena capillaripes]